ncbi:MAG: glutamine phosphoribosylpyrophosphate amidotransferase, partial [Chloroflexi bacterium]|nr:glutamine phosphoribosylpyrophosphate amidotransferase [Chloroflexota bacterium]
MCGIAGFLSKTSAEAPVGKVLLSMLEALGQRGPDSAGLALFGPGSPRFEVCWVRLPEDRDQEEASAAALARLAPVARVRRHSLSGGMVRVELERTATTADFCRQVETLESGLEIVSLGRHLELVKQVGAPSNVSRAFDAAGFIGSHGIGHTRLSTESRVDLSHSQPFWARGVPDLATVHNGHITN